MDAAIPQQLFAAGRDPLDVTKGFLQHRFGLFCYGTIIASPLFYAQYQTPLPSRHRKSEQFFGTGIAGPAA
jgi:hypothetical protein